MEPKRVKLQIDRLLPKCKQTILLVTSRGERQAAASAAVAAVGCGVGCGRLAQVGTGVGAGVGRVSEIAIVLLVFRNIWNVWTLCSPRSGKCTGPT
jgi:hypothetical protein